MKIVRVLLNLIGLGGVVFFLLLKRLSLSPFPFLPEAMAEFSLACFVMAFCFQPKYTVVWRVMALLFVLLMVGEGVLLLR